MSPRTLYPELSPFSTEHLELEGGHAVYVEQSGHREGLPVMFLHGGPGSGCNENHRRYFNPEKYRIIIFDQRGAHRSTPNGRIEHNTTQDILHDMESIRKKKNLHKLILFGGSWGATLALLYAEHYPDNIKGMILRGTFLARQCDIRWFANEETNGVCRIFPDHWQDYLAHFDEDDRHDLLGALTRRIFSNDRHTQLAAAKAWSTWAGNVVVHSLSIHEPYRLELKDAADEARLINEVKIEMHYARHQYFIRENEILDNITKIPKVPVILIHGRKDLTCLPESSWSVYRALVAAHFPAPKLIFIPDAGHLASEPTMIDSLITATDDMAEHRC